MTKNWRTIGELFGLGAVAISLLLIVYELRQTQISINLAAYQQLVEGISEFNLVTIENEVLRTAREKVQSGAALSPDEASIFNAFLYLAYRNGDLAYLQYEQGIIDEDRLLSGMGVLINLLQEPVVQAHWNSSQLAFVESYREYINQLITGINQNSGTRALSGPHILLDASMRAQQESKR